MPRTLLTGGTILVLDGETPPQEAMVAEGGKVVGVGARDEMRSLAGARAERLDPPWPGQQLLQRRPVLASDLPKTQVLRTVVDGRIVHETHAL